MELIKGQTVFVYDGAKWPEVKAGDIKIEEGKVLEILPGGETVKILFSVGKEKIFRKGWIGESREDCLKIRERYKEIEKETKAEIGLGNLKGADFPPRGFCRISREIPIIRRIFGVRCTFICPNCGIKQSVRVPYKGVFDGYCKGPACNQGIVINLKKWEHKKGIGHIAK